MKTVGAVDLDAIVVVAAAAADVVVVVVAVVAGVAAAVAAVVPGATPTDTANRGQHRSAAVTVSTKA